MFIFIHLGISVEGYSDNGNCQVAKINDRIAMNSEGGARIISLSSNRQMAAAMGIHTELAAAHPDWNAEAMYYAKKRVRLFCCFFFFFL